MLNRKTVTKAGNINIPKLIRAKQGIGDKTVLEVVALENGDILLKKITPTCYICSTGIKILKIYGKDICEECANKIIELLKSKDEESR